MLSASCLCSASASRILASRSTSRLAIFRRGMSDGGKSLHSSDIAFKPTVGGWGFNSSFANGYERYERLYSFARLPEAEAHFLRPPRPRRLCNGHSHRTVLLAGRSPTQDFCGFQGQGRAAGCKSRRCDDAKGLVGGSFKPDEGARGRTSLWRAHAGAVQPGIGWRAPPCEIAPARANQRSRHWLHFQARLPDTRTRAHVT